MGEVIGILPEYYRTSCWDDIAIFINRALKHNNGELSLDDVKNSIETGEYELFGHVENGKLEAIAIINMIYYPNKKSMNILMASCNDVYAAIHEFLSIMDKFAKDNECSSIYIHGRKGWSKVLSDYGYIQPYTVLERKL